MFKNICSSMMSNSLKFQQLNKTRGLELGVRHYSGKSPRNTLEKIQRIHIGHIFGGYAFITGFYGSVSGACEGAVKALKDYPDEPSEQWIPAAKNVLKNGICGIVAGPFLLPARILNPQEYSKDMTETSVQKKREQMEIDREEQDRKNLHAEVQKKKKYRKKQDDEFIKQYGS